MIAFRDPTKEEMLDLLKFKYKGLVDVDSAEDFLYDATIAMYWYASHYHSGQYSNLYSALSTSDYNPNFMDFENENEFVKEIYSGLEDAFGRIEA